ncbi:MAG: hypothetical protein M3Q30_04000, partial [Actinomycetota bacterium]|nr:hypothetical protein [Actinomycetota bacterium]
MLDSIIRGGRVVDGTGAPARQADVGIRDGRIVEIGRISDEAAETIDADGLVVAPGIVDVHTHYDAQLSLFRIAGPFSLGGVEVVPVPLFHGTLPVLGFRIGSFAY